MEEFIRFKKRFALLIGGMALLISAILFLLGLQQVVFGLIPGAAVAILVFWAHGNVLARAFSMPTTRAKMYVFMNFLVRYVLYFIVLLVSLNYSIWHFWGAVGGLLIPRVVILIFYTIADGKLGGAVQDNPTK